MDLMVVKGDELRTCRVVFDTEDVSLSYIYTYIEAAVTWNLPVALSRCILAPGSYSTPFPPLPESPVRDPQRDVLARLSAASVAPVSTCCKIELVCLAVASSLRQVWRRRSPVAGLYWHA